MSRDPLLDPLLEELWPDAWCGCGHHFSIHDTVKVGGVADLYCTACSCEDYDGPYLPDVAS